MKLGRWLVPGAALLALAALLAPTASAQPYPARPISMVVVFAAGGTADIVGRTLAAQLSTQLGKQVVVDNKPGAGGTIGATAVARSKPDGYTMLMLVSTHTTAETLFKTRQYELLKDFAPVSTIGTSAYWVLVNPEVTKANDDAGARRRHACQPGKDDLRIGRLGRHHAPRQRNDEAAGQARRRAHSVQGQRAGADRARGRPRRYADRPTRVVGSVRESGQAQTPCGYVAHAHPDGA